MSDTERSDKYFLQRIRIDGMPLSIQRLRVLASISTDFGRDTADITDRQNLQVHWIDVADLPEIWRRLESVGLNTVHTAGDAPRAFTASPVAGVSANEIVDPTPVIAEIREKWIGTEEVSNLPRKFKTCFTGDPSLDVAHEPATSRSSACAIGSAPASTSGPAAVCPPTRTWPNGWAPS